jgi:choline dehydrogenase
MHVLATSLAVLPLAWCGTTLSLTQSINNLGVPGIDCGYDYVVVGGGTSGLTIAARLAETAGVTVAVIEAGGFYEVDNGAGSVIPGMSAAQNTGTDVNDDNALIDWNFNTTPQAVSDVNVMFW